MSGTGGIFLADEAATERAGRRLAAALTERPFAIALSGPLGAGKSTLIRAVLRRLGVEGPVPSPTYALIEPYETAGGPVYHVDLYRVHGREEVNSLALAELLDEGAILLVEWPERGGWQVPAFDLDVKLDHADAGRRLEAQALSAAGRRTLAAWRPEAP